MESGIQVLMTPLPGRRLIDGKDPEDGSILAYRKGGDEGLFASWNAEEDQPMAWIPVGEFSPDPEAIRPPEIVEGEEEPTPAEDGTTEKPVVQGPFGRGGLRRRPTTE